MTQADVDAPEMIGRYRVEELLGTGGTATVHRVHDTRLGRDAALKRVRPGPGRAQHRLRLRDEGRLLAELDHPGLVTILDAAWEGPSAPYVVLELVDGPDLSERLREGALDDVRVATIGRDLASVLAHLHDHGLVHRDVKPANVLLDGDRARLCDLGIALRVGEGDPHGRPGHTTGSIAYLAPEQVLCEQLTSAVDVYALGLLLLEALTGRREYPGPDSEAAWARVHRNPTIPTSLGSAWTGLLAAMTARDPAERPAAREVAEHLEALLAVEGLGPVPDVPLPRHRAEPAAQELAVTVA